MTEQQTVIVTGAGTGIGRATALRFARAGFSVIANGRRLPPLETTLALSSGMPGRVIPVTGDAGTEATAAALVARAVAEGGFCCLVNNAGVGWSYGVDHPGTMAAVLGQSDDDVQVMCDEAGDVWLANFNCPRQVVVSGTIEGVDRLVALAAERGAKIARLHVAGAFHSPLMAPAAARLEPALASWTPSDADPPFLSTTTCAVEPPERMRAVLLEQLTSPVRFSAAVEIALEEGAERFIEFGPGKVLSGLVKRIRRDVETLHVSEMNDLAALSRG